MEKKLVKDKNKLFANKESECHSVQTGPKSEEYLKVWVKAPTFFEMEQAHVGNQIKEILPNPFEILEESEERKN